MGKAVARYGFIVLIFILTIIYVYPIFQGLVLLPLDLLVSNYSPWHFASTILLKNAYMQDSILQLFPWRHLAFNSLTHGQIPFWNPYQFTGMPFMAGMKPMVWYPINLLFPLGEIASWHALLLFQLFGSMFFMYLFMRSLGLRRSASLLSGIAFAFSTLMVGVLEFGSDGNALLWLPLFLFLVKKYLDIPRGAWLLGLGLSLACVVFAGHLQYLAYEMIIVLSFLFIYGKVVHAALKQYMFLGISMILGLGVSAVQIIPSFEMFRS